MAKTRQTKRKSAVGYFMTYTTFNLALNDPTPGINVPGNEWIVGDENYNSFKRWHQYLSPLVTAKGHQYSVCGRALETPRNVLLLTSKKEGQTSLTGVQLTLRKYGTSMSTLQPLENRTNTRFTIAESRSTDHPLFDKASM